MNSSPNRAVAIEQLTAPTFLSTTTPNRFWASGVWDGRKYNSVAGTFYGGEPVEVPDRDGRALLIMHPNEIEIVED